MRTTNRKQQQTDSFATILLLLLAAIAIAVTISAQAQAQTPPPDDSGNFSNGDEGAPPNTDSESVPGLSMLAPSYSGTGCPQGTASATLAPDGRSLSVLFDQYIAESSSALGSLRTAKSCQINIPFTVPSGYSVEIVKMEYRGFVGLPDGARSTFGAGYRLLEVNGRPVNARRVLRANVMTGPKQENFMLTSIIRGPSASPCGQNFVLAAESMLNVASNRQGEHALATVDSLDAVQTPVVYSLRWRQCAPGRVIPPTRPPRPMPPPIRPPRSMPPRFR